jgi:Raf kinase inhibitor-like YbhB/YbcL family protein
MQLFTRIFDNGGWIPPRYTCDGANDSPTLEWSGVPEGAKALVLIVEDPDAPRGTFVHWILYGMHPDENGVADAVGIEGPEAAGARQGRNDFGKLGYGGPCPPSGTHRYYFRLYALDAELDLAPGATRADVDRAMQGHVLAEAELMGRYERASPGPQ